MPREPAMPTRLLILLVAMTLFGCGSKYPLAQVEGTITLDGQPLPGARVGFEPKGPGNDHEAGPGSYGVTDEDGRYRLTTLNGNPGAVVAEHIVWVRTYQGGQSPEGKPIVKSPERLPPRYHDRTILTFVVPPEGSTEADFSLTSSLE